MTDNEKYEMTDEILDTGYGIFHRIRAKKDLPFAASAGSLGGFIESEENLSPKGNCWVAGDAIVFDEARIQNDAFVGGRARVYDSAIVRDKAKVLGEARVSEHAIIEKRAEIYGSAYVFDNARISGRAEIYEYAMVAGDSLVTDIADVSGNAEVVHSEILMSASVRGYARIRKATVAATSDYLVVGPVGSRDDYLTMTIPNEMVITGCFYGSLDELEEAAKRQNRQDYLDLIPALRNILSRRQTRRCK